MAFPVPDHLPKRPVPVDVSSKILYKIDAATKDTLNSSLAASWLDELDGSIRATKQRIHDRIQSDLPDFERQLETSKSVQTRYELLKARAEELENALSHPEKGIVPTLVAALKKHSTLAQDTSDAEAVYNASSYLLQCRDAYSSLLSLAQSGQLPAAVEKGEEVQKLVVDMPEYLSQTKVAGDLKRKFNATQARVQDQLSDAYSRSVIISPADITIYPSTQVRQSEITLDLPSILQSLSPTHLANHLDTLKRDILTHFIDHSLKQPFSIAIQTSLSGEVKLSLTPAPPNSEDLSSRLDNISTILGFLASHLFAHLPPQSRTLFMRSLNKPITTSILNNLLMPSLPSSFGLLPSYLNLLKRAVAFEDQDINNLLDAGQTDGSIKAWSDGISGHYERRRRVEILENARQEILSPEDPKDTFEAINEGGPETSLPSVVPVQVDEEDFKDDAWGLDEPVTANATEDTAEGWGFDNDLGDTPLDEEVEEMDPTTPTKLVEAEPEVETTDAEPDVADAWGWNDDEDVPVEDVPEENAWDDPWSDPVDKDPEPPEPSPSSAPKAATRLEKLANKSKKQTNGHSPSPLSSPQPTQTPQNTITFTPPSPKPEPQLKAQGGTKRLNGAKRPADVVTTIAPKELYKVPKRTKRVLKMVEKVIDESKLFFASNLFPSANDAVHAAPGSVLAHSASSIVELYEALYPIKFSQELESVERAMLFSNSCLYMTGAIQRIEDTLYGKHILKERLTECRQRLQVLGDSWYEEAIEREQARIDKLLVEGAQGFLYTADQDRYDECEAAVNEALKQVKRLAQSLKGVLTKSKYYTTIGAVADSVLSRMLHDILALPDIPEVESHRLSELCRIMNSMEGLFCEDHSEASFVGAYVPSWFKFSYLSELLEASLADITYLFEQGALVDFQVEELVNLVKGLFADTILRTNTVNKIMNGHPSSATR
ncbi:hypothetical protein D9613_006989 [Agrocybe pediades]|uniref:ZW10 C-terminal helical domain-containing protein n=1 Tax=Agrocybe pediades TaxID=84607 RepID=A0A8H4QHG6_9AGAR|nr:hypothetical protein D9613_006989 [Agrocybe pediades]